ncbi:MAG: methyltransferase domain-containing protein [Candidatus Binatia bacterium]
MDATRFPPEFFRRLDESNDREFYREPRLVAHIDDATIAALTQVYREVLAPGMAVLDLMSSWISHLPPELPLERVAGLGMNRTELEHNTRLTDLAVHDLNAVPELPYPDETFDAVLNAVSIQYLTRPVEVYAAVRRVLKPNGLAVVATSHRCFPNKAVMAWHVADPTQRAHLIQLYLAQAGGFGPVTLADRSPGNADPLWVMMARRAA